MLQIFEHAGYTITENVFTFDECDRFVEQFNNHFPHRGKAGVRNLMSNEVVRELASDSRLLRITESISGRQLIPFKATLFEKTGKANWLVAWHQDTALPLKRNVEGDGWGPSSVKEGVTLVHAPTWAVAKILALRVQLDASTETNGPLRVIPNSHDKRLFDDDEFQEWSKREAVTCLAGKGSVIAMSPLILHASSKCLNDEPRRVLHIEYASSLELDPNIRLIFA